jgi:hypothetical protein
LVVIAILMAAAAIQYLQMHAAAAVAATDLHFLNGLLK